MLKINKDFNEAVIKDLTWGQKASNKSNVMLNIEFTDEMLAMGRSREVTNRIQRMRKNTGISIEDQIEIYYEFAGSANEKSLLGQVFKAHKAKIETTTKMPLAPKDELSNPHQRFIGETEYVCQELNFDKSNMVFKWKDIPSEVVKLYIYLAGPKYNDAQLQADFGATANDIKLYMSMFDPQSLVKQVDKKGVLHLVIDGKKIEV